MAGTSVEILQLTSIQTSHHQQAGLECKFVTFGNKSIESLSRFYRYNAMVFWIRPTAAFRA